MAKVQHFVCGVHHYRLINSGGPLVDDDCPASRLGLRKFAFDFYDHVDYLDHAGKHRADDGRAYVDDGAEMGKVFGLLFIAFFCVFVRWPIRGTCCGVLQR